MAFLRKLLLFLAFASYVQGSEVELDLSSASTDSFDVVTFEAGPASVTRYTPKLGVYVNRVTDSPESVWSPLSKDFSMKSFEIHQRSGHNSIGHLALLEKSSPAPFDSKKEDNLDQNTTESLSEKVVFSNLYFTKREKGWFPLTKYHFDVLKDDMESLDSTLDLHNFSDSIISVSHLDDRVTREILLARRLSHVTRVNHNGDLVWRSGGSELFKSAALSYNTMNKLVLVKMTLTTPNVTYNPLDEKSTRYYVDRTLYFYRNKAFAWETVNPTFYDEYIDRLRNEFAEFSRRFPKLTLDLLHLVNGSVSATPVYFNFKLEKNEYRGMNVMMVSPLGDALLTVVKSGDSLLWVSEDKKSHCRDVRLYRLSGGSTLVDLCLVSTNSDVCQYKFFGLEGGEWRALSPENYKHLLNNDEISVVLDLATSDLDFCTKALFKVDGVPVIHYTAHDGYYFDKVKELEFELWNSTRFLKCKKAFHVNLHNLNFISLLIEDPLSNTSHLLYYQKMSHTFGNKELVWVPTTQAVHSSLMYSALMKISFDFDLTEFMDEVVSDYVFPFDLNAFPETKVDTKRKNYTLSSFRHKDVPMVRIYPIFASHLANFREGSNVIWSSKRNQKLLFLEFNYAEQPTMAMLMFSDENDVIRVYYYSRVKAKWNKVTVDEAQDYFNVISTLQDYKYFTLDVGKLSPSNKFTCNVEHFDTPPTAFVEPSYGYKVAKLVDGTETIWSSASVPTENSTAYGKVDGTKQTRGYETLIYASTVPYNDPKFSIVVTLSKSSNLYLNHYRKLPDGSWQGVSKEEYFEELDKYSEEYYQGEEIVDLSDVFKGEKRDYYEFVDSSYFGLDHYGVLKFTDNVENLSLYVNGHHLYKFAKAHYLKEVVFFPSNSPKVISLEYQFGSLETKFLYFVDSSLTDVDPFVKITTNYVEVTESFYNKQFEKLLMLKNYTTLDLSTYYKMVKDFEETNSDERDLVSYIHERLAARKNLNKGNPPLNHSVYNYLGVNFVVAEVNSDNVLKGVIDGLQTVTGLNFYPSTKIYFTLNNDYYLSIYYTDGHTRELKTLNYEKWNHTWSYLKTSFRRGLQALVDFASKPVSVDMFHLRDGQGFKITTQFTSDYLVNTLTPKPGFEIKRLYYNSNLIYDTNNGISKQIGLKDALENVIKVTFVPRFRPTLLYITSNTNSSILNKYYKVTNLMNPNSPTPSTISIIKSINVFDYNSLLDTVRGVKEFLVDTTNLHSNEDYRLSNHSVYTRGYLILTPNKDRKLVLLTQGETTIWEAQNELVDNLILYPQNNPYLALIYYNTPDGDGVHRYRYMASMNKWLKTTEEFALDTMKLSKENSMPFTLDLSTLLNSTVNDKDFMSNQFLNLYRRKIYGLLFTIVKSTFSTYIVAVKHNDKVLFDINADKSGASDQSNRVLSVVYAFKDDPRILALNFVRNFVPSQAYFKKNDEGDWEEISSPEYGKFLFLLKRFTMNPVVLDIDSPNPNFFTTFTDTSNKNFTMTRITPKDNYKISKVVKSNSSNHVDPFRELKLADLHQRSVQSFDEVFSLQDTSVLYLEYTDGNPSLLRLYYNTDMLFQVRKAYFVMEDGIYKSTTEENFNHLLSLAKSAGTHVTYNLDPYYRHGSPSYRKNSYEEEVVTVYNDKFDLVYPNYDFNISPVMFKETKVWEAQPHYQTLSVASYPSKNPNQMMVHYKDLLKNVVYSQYYKMTTGSGPSDEVVWKPATLYSNTVFDMNVRSLDFDLTETRVHSRLTVFSFEHQGLYTTVVLPNKDTLVSSISMDKRKIWTPSYDESTSVSEKLVKFYFTPSVDPKILVVYYRDFKGYVRLKDFKRDLSSFEWKESYSKFMSYYLDMLDSSFPLNLQSYDKSKFIFSTYYKYGFKIVSLYPLISTNITKIFSKPVDSSDVDLTDSDLIWRGEANENCFSLHFAPPEDPKVLLVYYSEKFVSNASLYYKDSFNQWILDNENTHYQFMNRLLSIQNGFVYHLEDSNLSLPSEFYTYEYTDVFGVRFGVCTPKPGKKLVSVTDKSMYVYEITKGERILDVLSAQPNNPDHLIVILDTNVKEGDSQNPLITYKYLKKFQFWVELGENEFLDSLISTMSTDFSPNRLTTKDLHNRVLSQLSVGTSHGAFMDTTKELSPPSDYEHFTLDLANYKENPRFTVKNYVESTVPRTVLRLKRGYLLTQLVHADQSIWTNEPIESSPSANERFVTHVYFAPTEDPVVLTLFFRDSANGVFSRRFVKNTVWAEFVSLSHDLTNDSTLFSKINKFVLDIHFDSMRYSSTSFKKELVYEDATYFMKISPRDNVDVVKLMYKHSQLWDKGEYDKFKSVLVYPINCPKFAKLFLSTDNGNHFFYFSRVNEFWSCISEQDFKSSLKKYFSHSSEEFDSVDLSNTKNYLNQTPKLNVYYANMHKLSFKSVSPRADYKISKVVFGPSQPAGDSDLNDFDFGPFNFNTHTKPIDKDSTDSELTVLFEPTSNEDIRLVSFSPEHDPKFLSITYTSTFNMIIPPTTLPKLIDSPYSPNQSPEPGSGPTPTSSVSFPGDYAYLSGVPGYEPNFNGRDMSSPFYLSVNTNHYYLDGDVWSITDDATFKSMCLKWADDHFERKQPFDLDVDNLELNKEKYDMMTEELAGVHFTKFQPKTGFEFSHLRQYEKVVYRQFSFPIISFSVFPLNKPRFFKISHRMSPSLINNYFFVSFYPYGLSQRDYPSFKKALFDYLNSPDYTKPSDSTKVDICKTELTKTDLPKPDLHQSTLVLHGKKPDDLLYFVDYNKDSTSGYSLDYDTDSKEFKDVVRTYSGNLQMLDYYLVAPTNGHEFTKLYDNGSLVFELRENRVLKSLLLSPRTNPTYILAHYTCDQRFNFFELYQKKDKWVSASSTVLKYRMKNIIKYHLFFDFDQPEPHSLKEPKLSLTKSPRPSLPSTLGSPNPQLPMSPFDKKDNYPSFFSLKAVPAGAGKFMLHGRTKMSDLEEKLEFRYDLLKNVAFPQDSNNLQTGLSSLGFKFYTEEEKHYRLVFVDEPDHNITKLSVNDDVLLDLTKNTPYNTSVKEFSYDLESGGFTGQNFEVRCDTIDGKEYVVVRVTQSTLSKVLEGSLEVWDPKGKVVEKFAYYPSTDPQLFLVSYKVALDNGEFVSKNEFLHKVSDKWVEVDQESQLQLCTNLSSKLFASNTEIDSRLLKGVLLMPAKDPVKLHVWYTENNFDKYVSFSRSLGKWTHTTLVFNDLVSVKLKFVTAQLRSDTVVFTGTQVPSLAEDRSSSKSKKVLFESVSVNQHFFVDQPEKDHFFYLPLDNFKVSNVSYGKHCFFKNADPQTDAANTKKVLGVYLTMENDKAQFYGKVTRLTVLFEDLMANVHSHSWVRDPTNKWSRISLTDKEFSALKDLLKETKTKLSKKNKVDTTVKFFTNFLAHTEKPQPDKTGLKLSGRVSVSDSSPIFFNYDLLTDEMDIYVSSHKTLFYSSVKDDTFNSFKLLVVKEGYEATVLKTSDRVLYSTSTDEKHRNKLHGDRIVAVYMTPATKPDSLCLYLSDRLGVKKLVSFRKHLSDKSKGSDDWFESPLLSSYANLLKFKFDQAISHSTSLRLECYDYTTGFFFGDDMVSYRQLNRSEYFVNTDSEVRNTPFKGFYSIFNAAENSTILIPLKSNKVSHIKCGTETLFSLSSQFHTVRALMITPRLNPDTVIVYYIDDENNDYYTSFTKLAPRTPAAQASTSLVESTAQKLFVNPNKLWQERQLMFFSSFGTIKKIHAALETFETNNPALVNTASTVMTDSSNYNLTLTLTGVYTPEDGPDKEFVFFYDHNHKGSAYVFDDERVVEHKNAFDLVFKNSNYMRYLHVKSNPSYTVKTLMMDSQVLMDFEGSSEFDSLTLTSPLNPSVLLLTTMDSRSSMYYYFVKKEHKWQTMGLDMSKYLKMKVLLNNASEEMKLLDLYADKPESELKRSSPVAMNKFDFNLSTYESSSKEYVLKKDSLSGYEFMVGKTRQNTNVGKILDSNLLVWNNLDNFRVVRFGFYPPKDPNMLCIGYILGDKEVFDFFHKTGGEWQEYYTMKNVPSLLTHISDLNLSSFVLDLSAVEKDSEHFKLRTHHYNGVGIVSGFVSPDSTLTSVVDKDLVVLPKSKLQGIKVQTFVYSQSENPTYFGFYFTDEGKKQYELYSKQEGTWALYFGMNEGRKLLLKELLHDKDTFDQSNPENELLNPENQFFYNISHSNNLSNKHYDVERQTNQSFDYMLVKVHKNQRLMKVLNNNLTVWTPREAVTQVLGFMYYPPENPIYFSLAYLTSSVKEVQFEYFYRSQNKWIPYSDPMNIPQILKLPLYSFTESDSTTSSPPKVVFDLSLDFSPDFYKYLYDYNLTFYKDLLFETFVPKSGVEVTKVNDAFNVIYHKLTEEKITKISFYPNKEPKLLLVDVKTADSRGTQKTLTRKFVLNNSWVANDEEFDNRVLSYSKSEQTSVSVDLSQLTKGKTTFEDFLVVKDSLNSAFESLVVTPILGKKIVSIFDGHQSVWLSNEGACLDSCYFFPADSPELLSVLTTDFEIKYYSKLNDKWSEVSGTAFEYLSSFYSGTPNTIDLAHLSNFEPVLPLKEDNHITLFDDFKLPSKEVKTRYSFLKTGVINYGSILFGVASVKSESDKSPSSTAPNLLAVTYCGEPLFKLNNDQKFLDLIFYPLDKPSMVTITFLQGNDTLNKFLLRTASEKHEWYEVDDQHFDNLFLLVSSHKLFNPAPSDQLKQFAFDLHCVHCQKGGDGFTLTKLSLNDQYYSLYVLETHRLSSIKDKELSVYEVPETDFVYNLYYNLDPKDTHLTLSYTSNSPDFPPDSLGYLYFEKTNGEWVKSYSFTRKLLDHDQLLSSTQPPSAPVTPTIPLDTNEFVYDMSKDKDSTVNFELKVETIRGVKLATVLPRAHKKLVHLFDSQFKVWSSGPEDKCHRVLYAPFDQPKAAGVVYSTREQHTVKYFMKNQDGSWNETDPDQFMRVLIPEVVSEKVATRVSLDFSNLAAKVLLPLQKEMFKSPKNLLNKPGSKFFKEDVVSFMFYSVPKDLVVTDLYDSEDLVYSSHIENVQTLQFYATKNDLYLRVTTDFLDHKTSHYFYTTLKLENQSQNLPTQQTNSLPSPTNSLPNKLNTEPVGCDKFTFDLSASNKTNKYFTLHHLTYLGHKQVYVKVHSDYLLSRLVDGKTLVWEQQGHVYLVNFGYLPEENPSHLCLGLYCAKGHKLWYTFYYKKDRKWHLYTHDDKVPESLLNLSESLDSKTFFAFDLSAHSMSTPDYEVKDSEHMGQKYRIVNLHNLRVLFDIRDGKEIIWRFENKKFALVFSYLPPKNPNHLVVTYFTQNNLVHETFEKIDGKWMLTDDETTLRPQLSSQLRQSNLPYASLPSVPVGCEKFTFDLTVRHESNDAFDLVRLTYLGHRQVYVKVHSDHVLTTLFDGKTVVWEQKGTVFLNNFGYMPERNPSHLCLGLHCTKSHNLTHTFYYKKGGKWHLYSDDKDVPKELLELSKNLVSHFNFDMLSYSVFSPKYELKVLFILGQPVVWVKVHPGSFLDSVVEGDLPVWVNDGKKNVVLFSFYTPEKPQYFVIMYVDDRGTMHTDYYFKDNGRWVPLPSNEVLESSLLQNSQDFSNLPAPSANNLPTTFNSLTVGCEKFTFDLSVHHESNDAYDLYHLTQLGHEQVYVKVHSDYVLTTLFDGKTVVWEQKGHMYLANFGYLPEDNPSHLCLGLYCPKAHKLWYTFYYKKDGKWHLYRQDDKVPEQLLELSKTLLLDHVSSYMDQHHSQNENQTPVLVRGQWQKIDKEEFYNNFLHISVIKEYVTFDLKLLPDVGQYETKEGFEFGHPIRISNPMPDVHVGVILDGNEPVWKSNSMNEHVKSILTVHENEYKHLFNSTMRLMQVYIKDRDTISVKYFKRSQDDKWSEIIEKDYVSLYDNLCKDFRSRNEFESVDSESDKVDSDAETVASTTNLCPSPDDLLVTLSCTDKESGSETTSQLKLNNCDNNLFVYTVDEFRTVYVPILKDSVKKLRLDDFSFYEEDKDSRKLMAFVTQLNTDGTLQRVVLFFRDASQPLYKGFVLDQGSWVHFSLLPDEESCLWELVFKATDKTLFPLN